MRQTQYNKLLNLANKFDSKWIKKAISANKARNTVSPNDSQILRTLNSSLSKSNANPFLNVTEAETNHPERLKVFNIHS